MKRLTEAERWAITNALEHMAETYGAADIPELAARTDALAARIEAAEYVELGPEELTP